MKNGRRGEGPVVYWVSRDQRVGDNYALLWAQQEALTRGKGLLVAFCLTADYPGATSDHYRFMLKGLEEMERRLLEYHIPFAVLEQQPPEGLPVFLRQIDAHLLVCDFDPLRIKRQWQQQVLEKVAVPVYEVDAHNIIPAWLVSDKKEYAAYTIRPKIRRLLDDYLTDMPAIENHPQHWQPPAELQEWMKRPVSAFLRPENEESRIRPGETAARQAAEMFIKTGLCGYSENRNNPCLQGQSGLSPYLHFGHLSPQRLALLSSRSGESANTVEEFLEELIVRRELADNFCLHEPNYDSFSGFPEWARKSLDQHRTDKRGHVYSLEEFERGLTHEPLWNACQTDLVQSAKLHGFLRMYWAKKILEWSPDPETALTYAIALNDRYSLDGRDPNGYTGIAWSIGGVHDRAWKERPVFGKIRYMNEAGCRRKFDTAAYIASVYAHRSGKDS